MAVHVRVKRLLLDIAAEVLVADPAASLAEVAEAAGIGRTTLHKHYATREDLLRAVGHRALDLWEQAINTVAGQPGGAAQPDSPGRAGAADAERPGGKDSGKDSGLRGIVEALLPVGPQLAFLWRNPSFDHAEDILGRWKEVEARGLAVLHRAQALGLLIGGIPDWWLLQTLYSLIYVAAESVHSGHLASRDAPDLVVRTYLDGVGNHE